MTWGAEIPQAVIFKLACRILEPLSTTIYMTLHDFVCTTKSIRCFVQRPKVDTISTGLPNNIKWTSSVAEKFNWQGRSPNEEHV